MSEDIAFSRRSKWFGHRHMILSGKFIRTPKPDAHCHPPRLSTWQCAWQRLKITRMSSPLVLPHSNALSGAKTSRAKPTSKSFILCWNPRTVSRQEEFTGGCALSARLCFLIPPTEMMIRALFPLAARLRPHVWHTLAAWAIHHEIIDAQSRLEMLRYACLDHFFTKTTAALQRKGPFEKAFSREAKRFPGKEIYQLFVANDLLSPQLILPDDFQFSIREFPLPQWENSK